MHTRTIAATVALLVVPLAAQGQGNAPSFDKAAYVTCKEAQGMAQDARRSLAIYLADHAARHRGVSIPDDERGGQLAHLVRGGCTLAPDAYLFVVIDRAIVAEKDKLPKR